MPAFPTGGPEAEQLPRVLVVEDDPDVLRILTSLLASYPRASTVETAVDGYEALIKVGTFRPSLLILDVVMPKLDGVEVCRRLRANPGTRHIKIVAITGRTDLVKEVLAAGADACLTKPFNFDRMDKELERFLPAADPGDL